MGAWRYSPSHARRRYHRLREMPGERPFLPQKLQRATLAQSGYSHWNGNGSSLSSTPREPVAHDRPFIRDDTGHDFQLEF